MRLLPVCARVRRTRSSAALTLIGLLAVALGCSSGMDPLEAPAGPSGLAAGTDSASSPHGQAAVDAEATALLARGELLSFSCRPCHALAAGDASPVGPSLHGMFGRPAATIEGFDYSVALRQSGITWTAETLDAWLAQPETFLPGNDMDFAGFRSAGDRRALIAYLERQTAAEAPAEMASD